MSQARLSPGVVPGRLPPEQLVRNFADVAPPLDSHEASVAADRCYFCHDAPCVTACPTSIDIPLFIRQIATGTPDAAARTIFHANILGGMCARVCPTENLCEGACVRMEAEGQPVEIGALQRYATDGLMAQQTHPFQRAEPTGKRVAVVGAGPAGLSAAHRLAAKGHDVVIFDARPKPGGLNEYGIAAYKTVDGFAQAEVEWLMGIGGIELRHDQRLGRDIDLAGLRNDFDAVFLGIGLGGNNVLHCDGEERGNVMDATSFIRDLRQASDLASVPIGRDVVVIGGGMTAIDAAVQARLLGAENVTLVYRRSQDRMGASEHEQHHATASGVRIICNAAPQAIHGNGTVAEVEFRYTEDGPDGLVLTEDGFRLKADQLFRAIGQKLDFAAEGVTLDGGKIAVSEFGRTSLDGVWAGGDCTAGGDDLTVTAVAEGRDAAEDIDAWLTGRAMVSPG
ncbi:NAD(P)-dependent oxidoreductase [Paracoccus seriniphilus]|uniref:NAD(P)-dependent oxidoreductase n=1 Tax=Paracoccus seriniphilus TaxID=184748 RepID=UPI003563D377